MSDDQPVNLGGLALIVALGATDEEVPKVLAVLGGRHIPSDHREALGDVRLAIAEVRANRGPRLP